MMEQLADPAGFLDSVAEIEIGLRAGKIVDRDRNGRLRVHGSIGGEETKPSALLFSYVLSPRTD